MILPRLAALVLACALGLFAFGQARAQTVYAFTLQWPGDNNRALPAWLDFPSAQEGAGLAAVDVPIHPPKGDTDLAVTIYFRDGGDGFLRLLWATPEQEITLSTNLQEGTGTAHQRTILIPRSILSDHGILTLQSLTRPIPLIAIRFEWVSPVATLASQPATVPFLIDEAGRPHAEAELFGDPYQPKTDGWRGRVIEATLTDRVERMEGGVVLSASIEARPELARVEGQFAGIEPGGQLAFWVNGKPAGTMHLEQPNLWDAGLQKSGSGGHVYAGWRNAALIFSATLLQPGENFLQFTWSGPQEAPVAAKDVALQLRFPDEAPPDPTKELGAPPDVIPSNPEANPVAIPFRYDP